jgi:hypothetical protein
VRDRESWVSPEVLREFLDLVSSFTITCRDAVAEGVVPGRQFGRGQRLEHVELVTIRVGHDHPAHVALADADLPGAERLEPGDFGALVGGAQIQVEPVLDGLAFGDLEEIRSGAALAYISLDGYGCRASR